eukprot:2019290-Rhodomonas_salina.4
MSYWPERMVLRLYKSICRSAVGKGVQCAVRGRHSAHSLAICRLLLAGQPPTSLLLRYAMPGTHIAYRSMPCSAMHVIMHTL